VLSTCNRVELYLARGDEHAIPRRRADPEFLAEVHKLPFEEVRSNLYQQTGPDAVLHLFRVAASLDSMSSRKGRSPGR